ncbi:hypothetical protein [Salinispora sp. H7-4]|uniref:hypothetical protein n=1 Tax=Salinispora sp. H7-4 TaxID=2748321 RepID=UPI0015D1A465|nr:hypothetical protein [Salinispora sp. H7-4]NYT96338.1 hypothetical protein [Salinispora sp. H7-4]
MLSSTPLRLHRGPRTESPTVAPAAPVSFGFGQARPMPAGNVLDLTGVAYDDERQVATVNGVPYAELGGPLAATVRQTREDGQLWDDKD